MYAVRVRSNSSRDASHAVLIGWRFWIASAVLEDMEGVLMFPQDARCSTTHNRGIENPISSREFPTPRTRGLCRDSLWFRGKCVKFYGADRQFWRPEEVAESLIAP